MVDLQRSDDTGHTGYSESVERSPTSLGPPGNMRCSGFSLVELLMVIAIISILTGVSTLSLKGISGGSELFTGGSQVANLLESARELAIVKKTPVAVALLAVGNNAGGRIKTARP